MYIDGGTLDISIKIISHKLLRQQGYLKIFWLRFILYEEVLLLYRNHRIYYYSIICNFSQFNYFFLIVLTGFIS